MNNNRIINPNNNIVRDCKSRRTDVPGNAAVLMIDIYKAAGEKIIDGIQKLEMKLNDPKLYMPYGF